jgi:hypothetical protein
MHGRTFPGKCKITHVDITEALDEILLDATGTGDDHVHLHPHPAACHASLRILIPSTSSRTILCCTRKRIVSRKPHEIMFDV